MRKVHPQAYRLYLELVKQNVLMLQFRNNSPNYQM